MNAAADRAVQLASWLGKESGCAVTPRYRSEDGAQPDVPCLPFYRFYFEKDGDKGWRYILDIHRNNVDEQSIDDMSAALRAANWLQVLQINAGKQVPYFIDKHFKDQSQFHSWPTG